MFSLVRFPRYPQPNQAFVDLLQLAGSRNPSVSEFYHQQILQAVIIPIRQEIYSGLHVVQTTFDDLFNKPYTIRLGAKVIQHQIPHSIYFNLDLIHSGRWDIYAKACQAFATAIRSKLNAFKSSNNRLYVVEDLTLWHDVFKHKQKRLGFYGWITVATFWT